MKPPRLPDFFDILFVVTIAAIFIALFAIAGSALLAHRPKANVTWYHTPGISVAAHPRHDIPDGAYIAFTNEGKVPHTFVIVEKRGHMSPSAVADFDLSPDAFVKLAPLAEGRLKKIRWRVILP